MELRIEYDIDTGNFTTSCLNAIRDFLSRTNDYELVTNIITYLGGTASFPSQVSGISRAYFSSTYSYFVAHSILNDLYLIFICFDGRVGLFVATNWDENEEIFYQKDVIYNGFYNNATDYTRNVVVGTIHHYENFAYYIPMPTFGTCNKLVANYNAENETVMFSGLEPITYNFGTFNTTQNLTHSMCFGNLTKYGNWDNDGGFWYGGDGVCSLELYFRSVVYNENISNPHPPTFNYARIYWQFESNCTQGLDFHKKRYWGWESDSYKQVWYDDPFTIVDNYLVTRLSDTINHFNRFECFLRIDMDNFPNRPPIEKYNDEYNIDQNVDRRLPKVSEIPSLFRYTPSGFNNPILCLSFTMSGNNKIGTVMMPIVMRKQVWATTTLSNYYVPMVASIDNNSKGLPTYWSLMSQTVLGYGHTVNDLNNISLVQRLYLMVQRDPAYLNDFSCVGYNDVINYVNMKNMSTNRYLNGTFPTKTGYYNCFQTGVRRSDLGFKGYAGLAFKMEEQNDEEE